MNENKKVFFIINKFSGGGYLPELEGRIIARCGALNLECTIEFTKERGHAKELALEAKQKKFDLVFAVGGDGTVNEVAQGLVNSEVTMGILPKGSGNGLARHLGIPMNIDQALNLLSSLRREKIDTMLINEKLSVNVSGIGFDAHIAGLFGKNGKRGLVNYVKLAMLQYSGFKEFPLEVTLDGAIFHRDVFMLCIANSSQFGNNVRIAPNASVSDGWMDVCFIKKVPFISLPGFSKKVLMGEIQKSKYTEIKQAKKMTIDMPTPCAYHIDGEAMDPVSHFSISISPRSLNVLLPEALKKQ